VIAAHAQDLACLELFVPGRDVHKGIATAVALPPGAGAGGSTDDSSGTTGAGASNSDLME